MESSNELKNGDSIHDSEFNQKILGSYAGRSPTRDLREAVEAVQQISRSQTGITDKIGN
jgi:hypothetical protein